MNSEARAGALPAYQGPFGGRGNTPPTKACTYDASFTHKEAQRVIEDIERARSLSILAEPICKLGIAFDKVALTDYYQAWIDPDAKVTFTLQEDKVNVYCAETITYSTDRREQERCALRSLVRSHLEDPEKLTSISAAVEILSSPKVQLLNEVCKIASQMARSMGISAPGDDIYRASARLVNYCTARPELIHEVFEIANACIVSRAQGRMASSTRQAGQDAQERKRGGNAPRPMPWAPACW